MKKVAYTLIGLNLLFILFSALTNPMPPIGLLVFSILFGPGLFVGALLLSIAGQADARRVGASTAGATAAVVVMAIFCLAYIGLVLFSVNIRMFY